MLHNRYAGTALPPIPSDPAAQNNGGYFVPKLPETPSVILPVKFGCFDAGLVLISRIVSRFPDPDDSGQMIRLSEIDFSLFRIKNLQNLLF